MEIKKPKTFEDLLNLQNILDENTAKTRENGFTPRDRNKMDIIFSIDDELQEWLKELPQECNFKTWKQKEYSRERELEEITDILFFLLQLANFKPHIIDFFERDFEKWEEVMKVNDEFKRDFDDLETRDFLVGDFKINLGEIYNHFLIRSYIMLCAWRNFTKQDILNKYWEKWQKNMNRISEDWTLKK